jgi:hypothetical protein
MRHVRILKALALLVLPALFLGCGVIGPIAQPATQSGSADFSVYVAVGTSVTAGWQSGGLVENHQRTSYAYLFAQQTGAANFTIPSVSADGVPALLRIVSLSPLFITNAGRTTGTFTNLSQPTSYHNMAVPYAILFDLVDSTYYYGGLPRPTFPFDNIVRHRGTILQQVVGLNPTFVSVEFGANEVLSVASRGLGTVSPSPAAFGALLGAAFNALEAAAPAASFAIVTVPNVTSIPFFTTFSPITLDAATHTVPMPLVGPGSGGTTLAPGDFVLLTAADSLAIGTGIPVGGFNYVNPGAPGNGRPLLDSQVLSAVEAASVQGAVAGYNDEIRNLALARGAALVDLAALLSLAASQGFEFQGSTYTADFITGGLFSLDGVHPTDLAHGFICNAMIDAVNGQFGARIPHVNLARAATATSSRLQPVGLRRPLYPIIENVRGLCPQPLPESQAVAAR